MDPLLHLLKICKPSFENHCIRVGSPFQGYLYFLETSKMSPAPKGVILIVECEKSREAWMRVIEAPLAGLRVLGESWTLHGLLCPFQNLLCPPLHPFFLPSLSINLFSKHFLRPSTLGALPEAMGKQNYMGEASS